MGIPSYFSYILKNHKHILKKNFIVCHVLYLDANSIIYDNIDKEGLIYDNIYNSIMEIISKFSPKKTFICFDGVAPLSKMVQQKQRRYKSHLTKRILNQSKSFNSNCITPGTLFMNELNNYLKLKINDTMILSGSDEPGEGEYKIFNYIRNEPDDLNHIIYGLDADLIMLSLLQLPKHIYLYRETKYFKYLKYIDEKVDYILDIDLLGKQINILMNKDGIREYCFLCFLCGNDFLPHFPSINIRNNGIEHLLEHYKLCNANLIEKDKIVWSKLYILFESLSKQEKYMIEKQIIWKSNRKCHTITHEDRLNYLPVYDRDKEEYLKEYPDKYNMILFNQEDDSSICKNYLEMLEWTWDYYTGKEVDLYKYYHVGYAPLFKSLLSHIPFDDESLLSLDNNTTHVNPLTQLLYVLPYEDFNLIPIDKEVILKQFPCLKATDFNVQYTFCHFFWESHVEIGYIPIKELDKCVNN